jgi:hypothetical protein
MSTDYVWVVCWPRTDWEVLQHRWVSQGDGWFLCHVCQERLLVDFGVEGKGPPLWGCLKKPLNLN